MDQNSTGAASDDADLEAISVPQAVKIGGGSLLLLGVLTLLLGIQTLGVVQVTSITGPIIGVMFVLGTSLAVSGFQLTRGSGKAAVLGTSAAGVTFVLDGAWFGFSTYHGLFSLLALGLLPLSLLALTFAALSIARAKQADLARERLRAQGLDSGL